ncbi:hypothetical protein HAX54_021320, partial [Datura stramonium]|nr:hypothetical protein [Datura stramonium]
QQCTTPGNCRSRCANRHTLSMQGKPRNTTVISADEPRYHRCHLIVGTTRHGAGAQAKDSSRNAELSS